MPGIIPRSKSDLITPTIGSGLTQLAAQNRRTNKAMTTLASQTLVRRAAVQAHAIVQTEKLHEIDNLAREAMSGQAMLGRWAATLSQGDPFVTEDLKFFSDVAKMGKAEIIADTITDYCQEGR